MACHAHRNDDPARSCGAGNSGEVARHGGKRDFGDLNSIIAAEAVYHSPVEWHPYPGHDLVCLLVRTAAGVFEVFRYERQMAGGGSASSNSPRMSATSR